MKVANPTPATRFGVTQQKFSRHRAASKPPMRNAVTLVVLEHVRTHETTVGDAGGQMIAIFPRKYQHSGPGGWLEGR